jgi:hypothetical protein
LDFRHWGFGFLSDFGFRISDLSRFGFAAGVVNVGAADDATCRPACRGQETERRPVAGPPLVEETDRRGCSVKR